MKYPPRKVRRSNVIALIVFFTLLLVFVVATQAQTMKGTISVAVDKPGVAVSPMLYGIFFEEINHSGAGGLYAELLENRWEVLRGEGKMSTDRANPLNDKNPNTLRLVGPVSVVNHAFEGDPKKFNESWDKWPPEVSQGLAVLQGHDYQLSLYARGQGSLLVTLEKQDGTILARHEVPGVGGEWKKFEAILKPTAAETKARLVISVTGTLWLDMVSLMPKGQLFREDLLKRLTDMKPAFVRFPGGCYVEGASLDRAFRWKQTIGDRAGRSWLFRSSLGEYAVNTLPFCGRGTLKGAVSEAAFMTGLERNSDVVIMASYAPLFERAGWKSWNPNAIVFDAVHSYATPSWYVQTLFSRNRADVVLPTVVEAPLIESADTRSGMIGVGTRNTQVEYKEIQVTQGATVLFDGTNHWKLLNGDWKWEGPVLRQSGSGIDPRATAGSRDWSDYTLTLKARKLDGNEGFIILFANRGESDKSCWNIGGNGNTVHALEVPDLESTKVPGHIETGRWYDIKVELKGELIRCYLDGKLIHEGRPKKVPPLHAVAGLVKGSNEIILKVANAADTPIETTIHFNGVTKLAPTAPGMVLTSASGSDENSFEQPEKVVPQAQLLENVAPQMHHTFPANSVTVWRLKPGN